MTLLLIRFNAFAVNLHDPGLKVLPYWLVRYHLEAVDENNIMPPDSPDEEGYCPDPEPAWEIEGYFYSMPQFYATWPYRLNIKSVREEESIQYDSSHPMLPWFDHTKPLPPYELVIEKAVSDTLSKLS